MLVGDVFPNPSRFRRGRRFGGLSLLSAVPSLWAGCRPEPSLPATSLIIIFKTILKYVNCLDNVCCYFCLAHTIFFLTYAAQMAFIIVAGICLCLYFLFLCFMVFQVFRNISGKQSSLPAMSKARRLHYEVTSPLTAHILYFLNAFLTLKSILRPSLSIWS